MASSGTDKKITATELATAVTTLGGLATTAAVAAGYQPLDSDLTAIAALTTTSYGRAFLALADAAAARTALSLGTAAVADTGTGASNVPTITQADARYQPLDSDLTAIAALSTTTFGRSLLTQADASAARTTLGLAIGTNVQAFDTDLTAIAALTSAADKVAYCTGAGTWALTDLTATARTLLDDASTSAMRTTLGLAVGTDVQAYDAQLADIAGITFAQGDILYFDGTNVVKLAAGTSGHYLKTQGAGANPTWAAVSGGGGSVATDTIFDAKGDMPVGTGADTAQKLTVGSDGYTLVADSSQTVGIKWSLPSRQLIASSVLGSNAATMDFTSIPATFRHLYLTVQFRSDRAATNYNDDVTVTFNNDTTDANYRQFGTTGGGNDRWVAHASASSSSANVFACGEMWLPHYCQTDRFKHATFLGWQDTSTFGSTISDHLIWASTAAINRLTFSPRIGTNMVTGCTVHIYGVDPL